MLHATCILQRPMLSTCKSGLSYCNVVYGRAVKWHHCTSCLCCSNTVQQSGLLTCTLDIRGLSAMCLFIRAGETMGYSMQALFAVIAGYMINETTKNYQKSPFYLVLGLMAMGLLISLLYSRTQLLWQQPRLCSMSKLIVTKQQYKRKLKLQLLQRAATQ
jgi:hypothetical protein